MFLLFSTIRNIKTYHNPKKIIFHLTILVGNYSELYSKYYGVIASKFIFIVFNVKVAWKAATTPYIRRWTSGLQIL